MKKEIKFRAWDTIYKNWFITDAILIDASGSLWDLREKPIRRFNKDICKQIILMQFTGLHDKNGKEIFEGDIVDTADGKREVAWNQLHCEWALFKDGGMDADILADWINDDGKTPKQWENKSFEIIGNIYESKHLLDNTDTKTQNY